MNFYDETVHCRLWQTQLVGCAVCGVMFLLATILFIILFRSRPLVFKDLPEDFITSSPITAPSSLERDETQKREHEEAEAIAAEAERRRLEQRQQQQIQQQQQMQRPMPQPRPSQPYQQHLYQTKRVVPGQLQHQGSNGYLNQQMTHQNSSGYLNQQYPPRISPQPQDPRMSVDNGNYYNSNYAAQRQHTSFDMSVPVTSAGYQNNLPLVTPLGAGGYSEEPSSYMDTSVDPNAQYQGYPDYAYGQFNPTETFDDPTSQEAQAHLAYANQLKEQQLYHQNMAEVLQKQQQQKLLKQQQLQQQDSRAPASGSTVDFYPPPPRHNSSIHLPPNTMAPSTSRVTARPSSKGGFNHPYATGATQNYDTGMVTPGSNSGTRLAGSPQHFPDNVTVTESHYSDDRYKADLIDEIRRARLEDSQENNPVEYEDYHDYKVQIASEYGGGSRPSSRNRVHGPAYVPPPNAGTSRS
ncbi:hypothetical protein BGZ46_000687 [Entomortierella lignicola]|nr:hypothetical protein BGZ46_000687 [Entomortierella lignicola]